ncbi:hypothetical protein LINGRAHAP2_LOCUS20364 [Linum grandiflorum]
MDCRFLSEDLIERDSPA